MYLHLQFQEITCRYKGTRAYLTKTSYLQLHRSLSLQKDWATSFNNINQQPSPNDNVGYKECVL